MDAGCASRSAAAMISARWLVLRPVPCSICSRQLNPSARMRQSRSAARTLGSKTRSPSFIDASYLPLSNLIGDRILLTGTFQNYWDSNSGIVARLYRAAAQYKLTCNTNNEITSDNKPSSKQPCNAGAPSLTLKYDYGTDRDTLQEIKKLSLQFSYAF